MRCAMRSEIGIGIASVVGVLTMACGGKPGLTPKHNFPSKETLDQIASQEVKPVTRGAMKRVADWQIQPADDKPSPLDGLLGNVKATRELRCIARELGRFHLEHDAYPDERLRHFIAAACGYPSGSLSASHAVSEVPADVKDEQIVPQVRAPEGLEANASAGGSWLGRRGNKVITMFVAGTPRHGITIGPVDANGKFVVQGTIARDAELAFALVNQGAYGVDRCVPDAAHALPAFSFACTMKAGDKYAWVGIESQARGRVLADPVANVLVRRDDGPLVYSVVQREKRPVTTQKELAAIVAEGVNRVRSEAKLPPLTLLPAQSAANEKLAPHFFNAELTSDEKKSDTVALGLLAGWDVGGTIRDGNFFGVLLSGTDDADAWVDYALDMPMGRYTLLGGEMSRMAVGAAPPKMFGGLGAVVTTYDLYGANDHKADAAKLGKRLDEARFMRGLSPHKVYQAPSLTEQVRLVNAGDKNEMTALDEAMQSEVARLQTGVRGWVAIGTRVEDLELPKELVTNNVAFVAIEVTHYKIEGMPWGVLAAFFLTPQQAVPKTAAAPHARTP
jgi:hypothetical protein